MHILIERAQLLRSLGYVQSVVERKGTIPILSYVKFEAGKGQVGVTATDMELALVQHIPATVHEDGAVAIPAHVFYEIVRKLPDGAEVSITTKDGGRIGIVCGSAKFTLACLPAEEFPAVEAGDFSHHFSISSAECKALLEKPACAMSNEEIRYYLNGIYLHASRSNDQEVLRAVATDGHRLVRVEVGLPQGAADMPGAIIPKKTIHELRKLLDSGGTTVQIGVSANKISFRINDAVLASKLVDGSFPDYERVIPANNDKLMEVNCKQLIQAVDRVSVVSSDRLRAVRLSMSAGKLSLAVSNAEADNASEELEVTYSAEPLEIGFNARYLLEVMAEIEGETAQFLFNNASSSALIRDTADVGSLYVVMPMRV